MRSITREDYPVETLQRLVNSVTFFKELIHTDPEQFELLMSVAHFVVADKDEIILHHSDDANILYFLLRGQLTVLAEDQTHKELNKINPGEVFGVMAMVLNNKRSASIQVNSATALLAGIDYQHFHDIDDFSLFNLSTKISFFRMLTNNIRWNLEQKKMLEPKHPLIAKLRTLPIYKDAKNTPEELFFLHQQAHLQADLLCEWNNAADVQ